MSLTSLNTPLQGLWLSSTSCRGIGAAVRGAAATWNTADGAATCRTFFRPPSNRRGPAIVPSAFRAMARVSLPLVTRSPAGPHRPTPHHLTPLQGRVKPGASFAARSRGNPGSAASSGQRPQSLLCRREGRGDKSLDPLPPHQEREPLGRRGRAGFAHRTDAYWPGSWRPGGRLFEPARRRVLTAWSPSRRILRRLERSLNAGAATGGERWQGDRESGATSD